MRRQKLLWCCVATLVTAGAFVGVAAHWTAAQVGSPNLDTAHPVPPEQVQEEASLGPSSQEGATEGGPIPNWDVCYPRASKEGILHLRLRPPAMPSRAGEFGPGPTIELTNLSSEPIDIRYGYWPYLCLSYVVTNDRGELLYEASFSRLASVVGSSALRLEPRETWASTPHLSPFYLREMSEQPLAPGAYQVQGVFRYRDLLARSNIIRMTLQAKTR